MDKSIIKTSVIKLTLTEYSDNSNTLSCESDNVCIYTQIGMFKQMMVNSKKKLKNASND